MVTPKKTVKQTVEELLAKWNLRLPKPLRDALKRAGEFEIAIEGCGIITFSRLAIDAESGFLILRNVQNRKNAPLDGYVDPKRIVYVTERPAEDEDEIVSFDEDEEA